MSQMELQNALAKHPFLHGLSAPHLATLAGLTQAMTMTPGQLLGQERDPANAFYLIEGGHVAIEIRRADRAIMRVQVLGAGDIVGWSWLVPPHTWQFDARVLETVRCLALDADRLRRLCEGDHELGYQLLKRLVSTIAGRLAATRRQVLDQS